MTSPENGKPRTVVVAMSGGVDSSVAAALLQEQGHQVIGMMMRLWSEPGSEADNRCCTPDSIALARRVAAQLGIPFYVVNAREVFHRVVVSYLVDGYAQGATPNPCLACNRRIRWEFLLDRALAIGADAMATGHYARLQMDSAGRFQLLRAVDQNKDQSYVLHVLGQEQLAHALFPLGGFTKAQVREIARRYQLPVAERPESQDLCFLGRGDYRSFLKRNAPEILHPGPILDSAGNLLGEHRGLADYTIGQRKGLGVYASEPLYVVDKDIPRNALIVGGRQALGSSELEAENVQWVSGEPPRAGSRLQVKIRYKAQDAWGTVTPQGGNRALVQFDEPLRDITPGQAAVFYDGQLCLGGGVIRR